ncbi:MAG: hypothetical protein H6707_01825 [Deltaproteobacteria bacterium]|nr:hypothetical protein [Deltaproteobacteria bacterium]
MNGRIAWTRWTVALLCVLLAACASDENSPSGDGGIPDGVTLFPCATPGIPCNAHDPCAIDPICGNDNICRPRAYQNCDDGLACTVDTCLGAGKCSYEAVSGQCALRIVKDGKSQTACYQADDIHPTDPCKVCNPDEDGMRWSGRTGGRCDDGNLCTKDDYCEAGKCKGTYYGTECGDELECTEDLCDGKGGCANKLKADRCKIGAECYKKDETDAFGCAKCDPSASQTQWTPLPSLCKIGATCYAPGAKDITGCGICDPKSNTTGWTPAANTCLIDGLCLQSGDKDTSGCGECVPGTSSTSFTPIAGKCLIRGDCHADNDKSISGCGVCTSSADYDWWTPVSGSTSKTTDFEGGSGGFSLDGPVSGVGWVVSTRRANSGGSSLYYGDPNKGTYDNGAANQGDVVSPNWALPSGKRAALFFWLYLDVEAAAGQDLLLVQVDGNTVWTKSASTVPVSDYRKWIPVEIDLKAYAGKTVRVTFSFRTIDGWANSGEGVFIDDIQLLTECGTL